MPKIELDKLKSKNGEVAGVSLAATSLLGIIDDPEVTREEISYLISVDQGLCANAFKYANSAAIGARREIESISEIVDYLGFNTLKQIASFVVGKSFIPDQELWFQSVFLANTTKRIAQNLYEETEFQEAVYIASLFTNYGRTVLKTHYKTVYDQITEEKNYFKQLEKERELLHYTHHEISASLLAQVGLPKSIISIIENQSERDSNAYKKINAIIDIAACLLEHEFSSEEELEASIQDPIIQELIERFSLEELVLDRSFIEVMFQEANELTNI